MPFCIPERFIPPLPPALAFRRSGFHSCMPMKAKKQKLPRKNDSNATLKNARDGETKVKKAKPAQTKAVKGSRAPKPKCADGPCCVVGIGASAGGLEAVTELLQNLPPRPGLAFVVVQHLDPTHTSALPSLLG